MENEIAERRHYKNLLKWIMTDDTKQQLETLRNRWRAAEAKANAQHRFNESGRCIGSNPQQNAAATRAFAKMKSAYEAAGISEEVMLADLRN